MQDRQVQNFVDSQWLSHDEGLLSVDVGETDTEVVVRSAIAGVHAQDLDLSLTQDTLTIRGQRSRSSEQTDEQTHIQECHWGAFSRSILLPSHVDPDSVEATLKRGILEIRMKKIEMDKQIPVREVN
jgi:HSP20 family protein